jgi:hypothetical protein
MRQSTYPIEPMSPAETERGRKRADPIDPSIALVKPNWTLFSLKPTEGGEKKENGRKHQPNLGLIEPGNWPIMTIFSQFD